MFEKSGEGSTQEIINLISYYGILALVLLGVQVLTGHFLTSKNVPPAMHTHMGYLTAFVAGLYIILSILHIIRKGDD